MSYKVADGTSQQSDDEHSDDSNTSDYVYDDDEISYHSDSSHDRDSPPPDLLRDISSGTRAMLLDPSAQIAYKTCDYTQFFPKAQFLIARVADLFCLDKDTAQVLLCHYHWDEERLSAEYFGDTARVLAACGYPATVKATAPPAPPPTGQSVAPTAPVVSAQCPVCYDQFPPHEGYSLCCGHCFCRECFAGHVSCQIREGPACIHMTCPAFQCNVPVALSTVLSLCSNEDNEDGGTSTQQLYVKFLTHNFISMNSRMRFCPGNGCEQIAYGRCLTNNVQCSHPACGEHFCFKCGQEAHDPCSCEQFRLWAIKCQDDNDTFVYLESHTRPCPGCSMATEPDAINCGYMRCKACAAFFCWHCMQITDDHRHRKACNKYVADNTGKDESEIARKRTVHYYGRYQLHLMALRKLTSQTIPDLLSSRRQALCADQQTLLQHLAVLEPALQEVVACRRVLAYTYVLGYYLLDGTGEKDLYEHQQSLLESNTDALAAMVLALTKDQSVVEASEELCRAIKATSSFRESTFATMMGHSMAMMTTPQSTQTT